MTDEFEQENDVVEKHIVSKFKANCVLIEQLYDMDSVTLSEVQELVEETNGYLHILFGDEEEGCNDEYYYHLFVTGDKFAIVRGKQII